MGRRHAVRRDGRGVRLVPSGYRLRHWPRARDERDSEAAGKGASCKLAAGAGHEVSAGVPRDPNCPRDAQTIAADQSGLRAITQTFLAIFRAIFRKLAVRYAGGQRLGGLRRCHQAQQRCRRGCQRSPGRQTTGGATTTGGAATTTFGRQTPNASRCAPGPHPCAAWASKLANDNSAAADATDRIILFICLSLCGVVATEAQGTTCRMYEC